MFRVDAINGRSRLLYLFAGLLTLLLAYGCGGGGGGGGGGASAQKTLVAPLPDNLKNHGVAGGVLSAQIFINGATFDLEVDEANNQVTGAILLAGGVNYSADIIYSIEVAGSAPVEVMRASVSADFTSLAHAVISFSGAAIVYANDDTDAFTNLSELRFGSAVANGDSLPAAGNLRSSANYVLADLMGGASDEGSSVIGSSSSSNYTLY
ncbi:MAG: hypothetical protein ACE5FN_08820 [Leptospirillia bacterium]